MKNLTYKEWNEKGYYINKGSKAVNGLFTENQVHKIDTFQGRDTNNIFTYPVSLYSKKNGLQTFDFEY